jgi:hypothetical protein
MKTIFIPRVVQVVIQDEGGRDRLFYNVFINGEQGTIFSLNGNGLRFVDVEHLRSVSAYTGCRSIEAVMANAVLDLLCRSLPAEVSVERLESHAMHDGLEVTRVVFKFKTDQTT